MLHELLIIKKTKKTTRETPHTHTEQNHKKAFCHQKNITTKTSVNNGIHFLPILCHVGGHLNMII